MASFLSCLKEGKQASHVLISNSQCPATYRKWSHKLQNFKRKKDILSSIQLSIYSDLVNDVITSLLHSTVQQCISSNKQNNVSSNNKKLLSSIYSEIVSDVIKSLLRSTIQQCLAASEMNLLCHKKYSSNNLDSSITLEVFNVPPCISVSFDDPSTTNNVLASKVPQIVNVYYDLSELESNQNIHRKQIENISYLSFVDESISQTKTIPNEINMILLEKNNQLSLAHDHPALSSPSLLTTTPTTTTAAAAKPTAAAATKLLPSKKCKKQIVNVLLPIKLKYKYEKLSKLKIRQHYNCKSMQLCIKTFYKKKICENQEMLTEFNLQNLNILNYKNINHPYVRNISMVNEQKHVIAWESLNILFQPTNTFTQALIQTNEYKFHLPLFILQSSLPKASHLCIKDFTKLINIKILWLASQVYVRQYSAKMEIYLKPMDELLTQAHHERAWSPLRIGPPPSLASQNTPMPYIPDTIFPQNPVKANLCILDNNNLAIFSSERQTPPTTNSPIINNNPIKWNNHYDNHTKLKRPTSELLQLNITTITTSTTTTTTATSSIRGNCHDLVDDDGDDVVNNELNKKSSPQARNNLMKKRLFPPPSFFQQDNWIRNCKNRWEEKVCSYIEMDLGGVGGTQSQYDGDVQFEKRKKQNNSSNTLNYRYLDKEVFFNNLKKE